MEQDYFVQERVNLMVEMANKKVMKELELLKSTVMQLVNEIADLRRNVSNGHVKVEMPKPAVEEKPVEVKPVEKPQIEGQSRYGNYTSEDVSVDKFFYFGDNK